MSLDLINISPSEILDLLKKAYYDQTGDTIQIGSHAFASSAAQSYAWSVLLNNINNATQNRFIDYANGQYLDAMAANYGITERPKGYHSSARFHITLINDGVVIPANALIIQDDSGNQFTNKYKFLASAAHGTNHPVLIAVEPGSKYNGIPSGEIKNIVQGDLYISAAENESMTSGGTDGFSYTQEGDDLYREWLKTEIQSFSGAGTYQAYEARAKNADSRVLGVYVLRQDDPGYQKGKVQIYIYTNTDYDLDSQVLDIVQASCGDPAFRPIGDLVEVMYSPLTDFDISKMFLVSYPIQFQAVAQARNTRILNEYKRILESTINKPFSFEELCRKIVEKDSEGVYALDCKPLAIGSAQYPLPIYPEIGGRLNPNDISFQNKYLTSGV